jgi:hypothetical protein
MTISAGKICGLLSALSGAVGTAFLYRGSFAFESLPHYMNDALVDESKRRNARRGRMQQIGLSLLMSSFVLAGLSVTLDA